MNNRTEAKLTDLSGMQKAIEETLKQAWERGRKYGQNEERPHGQWVNEWHKIDGGRTYGACCSLCHINGHSGYNFCPNCGADMKGE